MRRFRPLAFIVLVTALAAPAQPQVAPPPLLDVLGNVTTATRPIANALVIALNLKDLVATQTYSGSDGSFSLPKLPVGIYKVIAIKQGYAPAVATVLPTKSNHKLTLALKGEKGDSRSASDEIWQIRASLPPDILRELEPTLTPMVTANEPARLSGEMTSMTGLADQSAATSVARTSVGVSSRFNDNWQLGFRGNLQRIDDPTDEQRFGASAAQSSVMSFELRSSPKDVVRVGSTKSSWRYRPDMPSDGEADLRSHNVEWEHGTARLGVRYFGQENLFTATPFASDIFEIDAGTTVLQNERGGLGVSMRVMQESVRQSAGAPLRRADVNANASLVIVPELTLRYGLSSRTSLDRTEIAPRAGLKWKLTKNASVVADGMVKAVDAFRGGVVLPMIGNSMEDGRLLPRYAASFGVIAGDENATHVSAVASVTAIDAPVRVVFNDGSEQFWDGLYLEAGDVRHDLRVTWRQDIGRRMAVDVSTSAGTATPQRAAGDPKWYVTGDVQSIFFPTGTTLLISYREIRQPQAQHADYHSERVNVRMSQSLHLPLDLKLLLGLEVARAENSPFLLDSVDVAANGASRKYLGGLAVNF